MIRILLFVLVFPILAPAENWPQWRGPAANGISTEKGAPVEWSADRNVLWKVPLKGLGTSTPIVWGDRVFITSQIGDGPFEQRARLADGVVAARQTGAVPQVQFVIHAFSAPTGRALWEHQFNAEDDLPKVHLKHNLASPSVVTDGELLYAWFGTGQVRALDLNGKLVWQRHLGKEVGPFEILWAHGSSPLLYMDSLILLCDHQGAAYLMSVDKKSGKTRWKADRGNDRRSYTTPFIAQGPKGDELIINSSERIDAYNPATGEFLWHATEPNRVPVSMPVQHAGVLYTSRGYNSGPYMALAVRERSGSQPEMKWHVPTGAPYVSSLLYYDGLIYMATETGIASCVDATNGKLLWRERLGGVFSASPVAADGKVYLINEGGDAFVLQAGRELKILHRNKIGERTLASPAISSGRLFLRTDEHLIAIQNTSSGSTGN